jgi:hypothetical protein
MNYRLPTTDNLPTFNRHVGLLPTTDKSPTFNRHVGLLPTTDIGPLYIRAFVGDGLTVVCRHRHRHYRQAQSAPPHNLFCHAFTCHSQSQ